MPTIKISELAHEKLKKEQKGLAKRNGRPSSLSEVIDNSILKKGK